MSEKREVDLMKPRFKVIADYPTSMLYMDIGDILTQDTPSGVTGGKKGLNMSIETVVKYPHIFKKMEWHEDRKIEEMPSYVKSNYENGTLKKGSCHKVERWTWDDQYLHHNSCPFYCYIDGFQNRISARNLIAITESDYLTYTKSKP